MGMGALSPWHILLVLAVVLLLFGGRGKLSGIMGDAAKGIRAFREGLKGEDDPAATAAKTAAAPSVLPPRTTAEMEREREEARR